MLLTYVKFACLILPDGAAIILRGLKMMNPHLRYSRVRAQQERDAAARATCDTARDAHLALARLHAERCFRPDADAAQPIDTLMESLHHSFGDNDLLVARRQQREATGEALATWTEIVDRLEAKREWLTGGTSRPSRPEITAAR